MKRFSVLIVAIVAAVTAVAIAVAPVNNVSATVRDEACERTGSSVCSELNGDDSRFTEIAQNIINAALLIVGILAVAMIIFSGMRYVMASGDKNRLEQSKRILIYSVTGLIVSLLAYAIVNFVVGVLK